MTSSSPVRAPRVASVLALVMASVATTAMLTEGAAQARPDTLPLGDPDLVETRETQVLAEGVTLTRIVRGTEPAPPDEINTTTRGPWLVNVLTIDPRLADGHLEVTYGPDLGQVEPTTELVAMAGALAGVNASFFTFTADPQFPGDPVGLGVADGKLLSEPAADVNEVDFVVDARTDRVLMGHLDWSGTVRSRRTDATLPLEFVNHPPVVPTGCSDLPDPTQCAQPGDVVRFTPEFGDSTPAGAGVEIVLSRFGCVVRTSMARGTALTPGQTSLQATGRDTAELLDVAGQGCVSQRLRLFDEDGDRVAMRRSLFGVNGRYRLTADGEIVVPDGSGSFFDRNPRTIAGTTRHGQIVLATIDGRRVTSVGTTMDETAAVADALGMYDAVNLDGGGSTTMSVDGELVNQPSGTTERAVGDALVYVEH
jgi:Phosphodiester glycosidase